LLGLALVVVIPRSVAVQGELLEWDVAWERCARKHSRGDACQAVMVVDLPSLALATTRSAGRRLWPVSDDGSA
jgi:hypothetical protein